MKKRIWVIILTFIVVICLAFGISACSNGANQGSTDGSSQNGQGGQDVIPSATVTDITLNKTSVSLYVGDTDTLSATVAPSNATNKTVTWQSSNTSVATVSNGTITALKVGTASITATAGGQSASCIVTVNEQKISVTNVYLNAQSGSLYLGGSYTLTATILPQNATNQKVTWVSTNNEIVTVNDDGVITAVGFGYAYVVAVVDGIQAACYVKVVPKSEIELDSGLILRLSSSDGVYSYSVSTYIGTSTVVQIPAEIDGILVEKIGWEAFNQCDFIESISIPNTIKEISDYAFHGCKGLKTIFIPASVEKVGKAFYGCSASLVIYCEASMRTPQWDNWWDVYNQILFNGQYTYYRLSVVWGYSNQ